MLSAGGNLSQMISMKVRGRVNSVFEGLVELQAGATWQSSRIFTELGGAMDEKLEVVIFFYLSFSGCFFLLFTQPLYIVELKVYVWIFQKVGRSIYLTPTNLSVKPRFFLK
jgi:hypothetical protein